MNELTKLRDDILAEIDGGEECRGRDSQLTEWASRITAMQPFIRQDNNLMDALAAIGPFEMVQGDSLHRLNPGSQQVVNSNLAWAVSSGERSAHKLRKAIETINNTLPAPPKEPNQPKE